MQSIFFHFVGIYKEFFFFFFENSYNIKLILQLKPFSHKISIIMCIEKCQFSYKTPSNNIYQELLLKY